MNEHILHGKTVLITGGAVRVGRCLAIAAAGAGADVILHYAHSSDHAAEVVDEITRMGVKCRAVQQDFSKLENISRFMEQ